VSLKTPNTLFELWFEWSCDHCEKVTRRDLPGLPYGWTWHWEHLPTTQGGEPIVQHACETCSEDLREWLQGGDNAGDASGAH